MKYKKIIVIIIFLSIYIYSNALAMNLNYDGKIHEYKEQPIILSINNEKVITKAMPPVIINNRTLVPAREVFEKLGATVEWDGQSSQVFITLESNVIIMGINNKVAYINQMSYDMDLPPKIINGKTMIPVRFVAESLGFEVKWDDDKREVLILTEQEKDDDIEDDDEDNNEVEEDNNDKDNDNKKIIDISKDEIEWDYKEEVDFSDINEKSSISSKKYKDCHINDINLNVEDCVNVEIDADYKISDIEHKIWNDKLIIDIKNSKMEVDINDLEIEQNKYIKNIRVSQFKTNPNVSRIVIDLKGLVNYNIKLDRYRKKVNVEFWKNEIYKFKIEENDDEAEIEIRGIYKPYVNLFRLTNPDRLVIDFPNAKSYLGYKSVELKSDYINKIRTSQFDKDTMRVVLETKNQPDYKIDYYKDDRVYIKILEPEYKNIVYDNNDDCEIMLETSKNIDVDDIDVEEDYYKKEIILDFDRNYEKEFGKGEILIDDERVKSVVLTEYKNKTRMVIKTKEIMTLDMDEKRKGLLIKLIKPRERYDNIVLIDPGHGGVDPGASVGEVTEKALNLDMCMYLYEKLEKNKDIKVYMTRKDDTYPTLQDRVIMAEDIQADLFISIHNNAALSTKAEGTEVLYYPTCKTKGLTSKVLADSLQKRLVKELKSKDRGIIPREGLYLLRKSSMPAVIIEVGYMTNSSELKKLSKESYQKDTADAVYYVIKDIFKKYGR